MFSSLLSCRSYVSGQQPEQASKAPCDSARFVLLPVNKYLSELVTRNLGVRCTTLLDDATRDVWATKLYKAFFAQTAPHLEGHVAVPDSPFLVVFKVFASSGKRPIRHKFPNASALSKGMLLHLDPIAMPEILQLLAPRPSALI